ncbi:M15 family metallopeptidase [Paenibacillus sp.]|uniref:M15 family metallopeptidase n=1 Tax=Paenibacillus sp. TaxID=58172 RepID=UPI002D3E2279|nr:M15 family metallopeptidase [Paenibacillus sp.]HZG83666.1 M15 family metallopeptidase [Paenibacillus sp.]
MPKPTYRRFLIAALAPLLLFAAYRAADLAHERLAATHPAAVAAAKPEPSLRFANERTAADIAVVVNREHPLPPNYAPDDLTEPDIPFAFDGAHEKRLLREPAARAAEQLFDAAKRDGVRLVGVSGYRSFETQQALFAFNVRTKGRDHAERYSAVAGASEHQTGLALDVSARSVGNRLVPAFAATKEGRWLADNAYKFGFVIRYPRDKEDITGYAYEPWHIRYVGRDAALTAYAYDLTLEEMAEPLPVFSQ